MELDAYDQAAQAYMAAQQKPETSTETTPLTVAPETTEEQSVQEGTETPVTEGEQQEVPNWNPQEFSFKADGKMVLPKTKEEAISYMQQGYHYNIRAQKLNQKERELYSREEALKTQQPQQQEPEQKQEEFNPFAPQKDQYVTKLEQRLGQLEQFVNTQSEKQSTADATMYATQVEDFAGSLAADYGLIPEEIDEFIWDAMQIAEKFPEKLNDMDDLKAYFFKTHPDAPEKRAKMIAEKDISKFKSKMSHDTVVNGTTVGNTPTTKVKIGDYETAKTAAMNDPRLSNARGIS